MVLKSILYCHRAISMRYMRNICVTYAQHVRIIQFQFLSTLHFTLYRVMEVIGYWLWGIGEGLKVTF